MISKWHVDLERKRGSFGNFVVAWQEVEGGFSLEITNAPGLNEETALEFAAEAAQAIADAIRRHRRSCGISTAAE